MPSSFLKKILMIDNYDSFTFNLIQLVESCGYSVDVIKNDAIQLQECQRYHKILISPGPGLPVEAGDLCHLIKTLAPTHSILGVCLGHQAIAEVFGGSLFQLPEPMHGKQTTIQVLKKDHALFAGLPSSFCGGLYHSWAVSNLLPEKLKVTARSYSGVIMGLAHSHYDVQGIQFHPESIMTAVGQQLIHNWLQPNIGN